MVYLPYGPTGYPSTLPGPQIPGSQKPPKNPYDQSQFLAPVNPSSPTGSGPNNNSLPSIETLLPGNKPSAPNPGTTSPGTNLNNPTSPSGYNLGNIQYDPRKGRYANDPFAAPAMDTTGWNYFTGSGNSGSSAPGMGGPPPINLNDMWNQARSGYGTAMPPSPYQADMDNAVRRSLSPGAPTNDMIAANTEYWSGNPQELRNSLTQMPSLSGPASTATTTTSTPGATPGAAPSAPPVNANKSTKKSDPAVRGDYKLTVNEGPSIFEARQKYASGDPVYVEHYNKWKKDPNYRAMYAGLPGIDINNTTDIAPFKVEPLRTSKTGGKNSAQSQASWMLDAAVSNAVPKGDAKSDHRGRMDR